MKKAILLITLTGLLLFVVVFLSECCMCFECQAVEDGLELCCNDFTGEAFAGYYFWNGDLNDMVITIPDKYENYAITRLGGVVGRGVPSPFYVGLPDEYCNEAMTEVDPKDVSEWYPEGYEIVELEFTLNLGKEVMELKLISDYYSMYKNEDGSYKLYHPVYYINCAKENMTFYSDNGKLYYKKNDKLVTEFAYPEESK